ncbi:MAG: hypothetical protein ACRDIE_22860 [Chloroflexota bacterium]
MHLRFEPLSEEQARIIAGWRYPPPCNFYVATFNHRAIAIYTRAGLRPTHTLMHRANGGEYKFMVMVRSATPGLPVAQ